MFFVKILNLGCNNSELSVMNKVQVMNFITLITVAISAIYTLFYYFYLNEVQVAFINLVITISYAVGFIFMLLEKTNKGKIWFFIILMLHLWVCTNVIVSKDSGFHLFYFLVPTGAFLLFELNQYKEKISLSVASIILLFYCENSINQTPLVHLEPALNEVLYQSVIFCIMVEVLVVLSLFGKQLVHNENKLKYLATLDKLTQTNNRDYFFETSDKLFINSKNNNRPFSLLLINIDNFKKVNQDLGYKVGDRYLQLISHSIQQHCAKSDVFGRLGGEEFAIAMPEKTTLEAKRFANKITSLFAKTQIAEFSNMNCTASIGVITKCDGITCIHELISCADQALNKAKVKGFGRVEEY